MSAAVRELEERIQALEGCLAELLAVLDDADAPAARLDAARERVEGAGDGVLDRLGPGTRVPEPARARLASRLEAVLSLSAVARERILLQRGALSELHARARGERRRLQALGSRNEPAGSTCDLSG